MSVKDDLKAFLEASPQVSMTAVARSVGVSVAVISSFLSGTYAGDNAKVEEAVQGFLSLQKERKAAPRLDIPFVTTNNARRVFEVLKLCHLDGELGVITGDAGLGKTKGVREYSRRNRDVILTETDLGYTAKTLFSELGKVLGFSGKGHLHTLFDNAVSKLKGSGRLWVIDEAEHLPYRALEMVRRLHDKADIGICLVGMPRLASNIRERPEDFRQIYSRVGIAAQLLALSEIDVEMLVKSAMPSANGASKAFYEESRQNARHVSKLLRRTQRLAEINKAKIDKALVRKAAETLFI